MTPLAATSCDVMDAVENDTIVSKLRSEDIDHHGDLKILVCSRRSS